MTMRCALVAMPERVKEIVSRFEVKLLIDCYLMEDALIGIAPISRIDDKTGRYQIFVDKNFFHHSDEYNFLWALAIARFSLGEIYGLAFVNITCPEIVSERFKNWIFRVSNVWVCDRVKEICPELAMGGLLQITEGLRKMYLENSSPNDKFCAVCELFYWTAILTRHTGETSFFDGALALIKREVSSSKINPSVIPIGCAIREFFGRLEPLNSAGKIFAYEQFDRKVKELSFLMGERENVSLEFSPQEEKYNWKIG